MKYKIRQRNFALFSAFVLILNSLSPLLQVAYAADEATPTPFVSPEPTAEAETPTPTIDQSQSTDTITPTPDQITLTQTADETIVSPTPSDTPTETIIPTPDQASITPTPEETLIIDTAPTPANDSSPPSDNNSSNNSTPTENPAVLPSPTETTVASDTSDDQINAIILENISAPSIDLESIAESGSAVLTTDKTDYAPTDTALITGSNLESNSTYSLTISSSDDPATSTTVDVVTNENGFFVYAYQLDGTYRPNYSVELKDSTGTIVATTTFTDAPISGCTNDSAGANDEPGQKDLNLMCAYYSGLPTSVSVLWNWDEQDPGGNVGGNTGDACSLFDTDGDGLVNYSLCVVVDGDPSVYQSKVLYSCGDGKADRCTNPIAVSPTGSGTSCTANVQATDPFPGPPNSLKGDDYPNDTVANCTIALSDVGGAGVAELVDVCSYPSQQPNSDPSDCIMFRDNTARLEVVKDLIPYSDSGKFNLQIDSVTQAADVGDNGTTGEEVVTAGSASHPVDHTVGEVAETGTSLGNYSTAIVCKNQNGTGTTIAQSTNSGPLTVSMVEGEDVVCTITNTLQTGSVKVNKLVDRDGNGTFEDPNPQDFNWNLDTVGTNAMGSTVSGVNTGSHSIDENNVTNYHFVGWYLTSDTSRSCTNNPNTSRPVPITVSPNQLTQVTLCNAIDTGTIAVHKDVQGPNGEDVTDISNNFKVSLDSGTGQDITDNGTVTYNNVPVGSHTITESLIASGYTLYGISTIAGTSGNEDGLTISVTTGTNNVYVTNRQQNGTVTVIKDVVDPDNGAVSDSHSFTVNVNPGDQSSSFAEGNNAVFTVVPGTYTASESADIDYTNLGCKLVTGAPATNFAVGSGEQVTVTCTNKQKKATINVEKDVLSPTGEGVSDNHAFTAQLNGGNNQSFSEQSSTSYPVNPGNYSITELSDNNYDYIFCTPDANQTAEDGAQVTLGSNGSITITCTNKQKNAQATIVKDVRDPNGADVSDNTNFVVQRDGSGTEDKDFRENLNAVYTLAPGTYTFEELVTAGYTLNSISGDNDADVSNGTTITLNSGENQTITFTNYQNYGSISGQKFNDNQTNLTGWTINLLKCAFDFTACILSASTTTDESGYSFLKVIPGFYQVQEVLQAGWTNLTSLFQNVTVNPDEDKTSINFTNFENVSVTACKKVDADGDISTTGDQTNKSGWTVNLLTDEQTTDTKTTEEDGCYTWSDLGPDHTYGVSEATPSDWTALTDTTYSFGQATGGSQYIYTFVNFENILISGYKFDDVDGNGIWDQGEPALEDWEINLSGAASESTTTNGSGEYSFVNLGPGSYTVSETTQTGWTQTVPNDGTFTVNAQSGINVTDKDFGNQGRGSITVHKNVDGNGDGDLEDEADIIDASDWTWDINGEGNFATGDENQGVAAGTYTVSEDQQVGYHVTGVECNNDREYDPSESIRAEIEPGQNMVCTFTNARDTGMISGIKYEDLNADGEFDSETESSLPNWTINLYENNDDELGDLVATTTTTTDGYEFNNVPTGSYFVCEEGQDGWYQSSPNENSGCYPVTLSESGKEITDRDFGNYQPIDVTVIKDVVDSSGNPVTDTSTQFDFVLGDHGFSLTDGEQTTYGLNPGEYTLTETNPSPNYTFDKCTVDYEYGGEGISTEFGVTLNLVSGDGEVTITCTNRQNRGTIIGMKWDDQNGDGKLTCDNETESCEPGIPGWHVRLFEDNDGSIGSQVGNDELTNQDGNFSFDSVNPGNYWLCEVQQPGWEQTYPDFDSRYPNCYLVRITSDGSSDGNDFGNHNLTPTITISKSNDATGDKGPGDNVGYTIVVTVNDADANNLTVTDLLPKGFTYNRGSWSVDLNGSPLSIPEPSYASPGVWSLGNAQIGDVFTLKYTAKIDNGQHPGLYKDLAWAQGFSLADSSGQILAVALPLGFVDTNFVGTEVNVVKDTQNGASISINKQEVLGASIFLPATGENTLWVIIATLMLALGAGTLITGFRLKKRYE